MLVCLQWVGWLYHWVSEEDSIGSRDKRNRSFFSIEEVEEKLITKFGMSILV